MVPTSQLRPADPASSPSLSSTYADGLNMSAYWNGQFPAGFGDYAALAPSLKIQKLAPRVRGGGCHMRRCQ